MFPYIDRVESKSNIADSPSRGNIDGYMEKLNAQYRQPIVDFDTLLMSGQGPASWFGGKARWDQHKHRLLTELCSSR